MQIYMYLLLQNQAVKNSYFKSEKDTNNFLLH